MILLEQLKGCYSELIILLLLNWYFILEKSVRIWVQQPLIKSYNNAKYKNTVKSGEIIIRKH